MICRMSAVFLAMTYDTTLVITPDPTVRPPSRMAKRICSSMGTGLISSISIFTLSPGLTISPPLVADRAVIDDLVARVDRVADRIDAWLAGND